MRVGDARLTRRQVLGGAAALGAGLAVDSVLSRFPALAAPAPTAGKLSDIEHVVFMMQENRSFDHYFGTFPGVRGFGDPTGEDVFAQVNVEKKEVFPFRIDTEKTGGGCTTDPDHTWYGQHRFVNDGAMDGWMKSPRAVHAPIVMGYHDERDIPYHFALAKSFTICDHYFCSVQGPTDPNRSYAMTGTIDPDGLAGGPFLDAGKPGGAPIAQWRTMPEQLEAAGISWKIYSAPDSTFEDGDNTVIYFTQYHSDPTLNAKALVPTYDDFLADAAAGELPQVSWLISPVGILEHPVQSSPHHGAISMQRVVKAVTESAAAWKKTALFITYDENGGFFDHVAPPMPPPGTPGEFLTVPTLPTQAGNIAGPAGLGPRVPMLIVSPFSRGGFVSSDTFDHTSMLRFLETRFGVEVPNLSAWRRETTGDLTSAFNFAEPDASVPKLPKPAKVKDEDKCSDFLATYPVAKSVPEQPSGRAKRPSGVV